MSAGASAPVQPTGGGAFPPPPDFGPPPAPWAPPQQDEQERFNAFRPESDAEQSTPPADAPAPQVRNVWVLLAVLIAAILILAVPLGTLYLLGKIGDEPAAFNPSVGECVKQSGDSATTVDCGDPDAYTVVSKVDDKSKCDDPTQPHVAVQGSDGKQQILCLRPAGESKESADAEPEPTSDG